MSAAIDRTFEQRLAALINSGEPQIIQGGRKGVEKESLRVTPDGQLAQTPHPLGIGYHSAIEDHMVDSEINVRLQLGDQFA